ncbi:UDP-N-acetylmuramate dehydrogenase [Desulfopila sp. IMCC35006]|uniref:UDP-N-acetylmuramate dehydrogenase n=1 Tax=Desulfopila sp. IMCC35006 TaxID=2569542 RepID=UPI00197AE5B8|nr:UDP-N-acetylmuramate dehydrogenase [Desulfopila sp. IMCC35006]
MNITIRENFSLKKYNTFGIETSAKYFVEVHSCTELKQLLTDSFFKRKKKLILGGGSNILFTKYFDGLVIKKISNDIKIIAENEDEVVIEASAGVIWHDLVLFCVERNFGGIENLSLIPGTVGAAPIQNIGAYGQELQNVFNSLEGITLDNLEEKIFQKKDCNFGYRNSIFKSAFKNNFVITKVTLILSKNPVLNISYHDLLDPINKLDKNNLSIKDICKIVSEVRRSKLPDYKITGNAGSFFKNPAIHSDKFITLKEQYPNITGYRSCDNKVKISAAWLIEQAGLKGKKVGNTGIHVNHALVIVNYGNAKGEEIRDFQKYIKDIIATKFGIELEEEVNII